MKKRTGKNTIWKSTLREIRQSLGRFMAILAIVAMGVGFFAGLKITRTAMVETTREYLEENHFYDYRLLSTLGFQEEDLAFLTGREGVLAAEGSVTADILYTVDEGSGVIRAHTLTENVNNVKLLEGRLPENGGECVVDANLFSESPVGKTLCLAQENEQEDLDFFAASEYTIVGVVQSPCYLQYERGNTSLGNGRVNGFMYLLPEGFATDYYTEIFVKFQENFPLYSDEYEEFLAEKEPVWEELTRQAGEQRYMRLVEEGNAEIKDAREELAKEKADGLEELADAKEELDNAEAELADAEKELSEGRQEIEDGLEELANGEREIAENEVKLADAAKELEEGERELADAMEEWEFESKRVEDGTSQLENAQNQLDEQQEALLEKEAELAAGEAALAAGEAELNARIQEAETGFEETQSVLDAQRAQLQAALTGGQITQEEYDQGMALVEAGQAELEANKSTAEAGFAQAKEQLAASGQELSEGRRQLEEGKQTLAAYQAEVSAGRAAAEDGSRKLSAAYMEIQNAREELERGRQELSEGGQELADAKQELADGRQELADAQRKLSEGEQEYRDGLSEYEEGLKEYEEGLEEFQTEIKDAEAEIADAEKELADLEEPDTYVLGREANVGYVCFENDSAIVDGIANIFPVFFFLVAALVCSTTMNRMVEEQRTLIGTLKALGYGKGVIMSKYLFYAGAAALAGCLAGFAGGTWLFPRVIWSAYGIMYRVDRLVYVFDWRLAVLSLLASLLCTMGTTYLTCRHELSRTAAGLMRPKAPKAGKRVFLEHIPFIWKRLGFLHKVSVRNIFRYKKRLIMMVIGISGCTALLVTGFGVKDSIAHIAEQQFSEIQTFDIGISFADTFTDETDKLLRQAAGEELEGFLPLSETSMDLVTDTGSKAVNVVIADEGMDISPYLNLHTESMEAVAFPKEGEAVVTAKAAEELNIAVGDTVTVQDEDRNAISVRVSGISRNFLYNYVYMNEDTWRSQTGTEPERKSVWLNVSREADVHQISAALMQTEDVVNVTVNQDIQERFTSMMASMNLIVAVIIICAGGLAFIVLYNLTNINITERVREIATIKVLGFYKKETAAYVFRENAVLTFMGAMAGLPLGCLLHRFVMDRVRIDMVSFDTIVTPLSYLLSAVITMLFAVMINRLMRGKVNRVSMTESLKSVD